MSIPTWIKQSSLLIIILFAAGCTPSVNQVDPHKYYTLQYQPLARDSRADKPVYGFVKVDLPHISSKNMAETIIYSARPFQKNSYSQSRWKEPLPAMLQEWLVQSIDTMQLFQGVIRSSSRANVPLVLETDIVKFEHVLYTDEIDVSIRLILIQYNKRRILKQKLFNYKIKVEQASAESAVSAFNRALKKFDNELYLWLSEQNAL